jgi:hypothetical protein
VLVTSVSFTEYVEEPDQAAEAALERDGSIVYLFRLWPFSVSKPRECQLSVGL